MTDIAAFVIAGGQSSRMGRDKAFLTLDGLTLLERALVLARSITEHVKIVGRRELFSSAVRQFGNSAILDNVAIVEDIFPGQGPLAGIHAALQSSACELNLMIGVDTPFLDPRFAKYLVEQARESGAVVTVPVTQRSGQGPVASGQRFAAESVTGNCPTDHRNPKTENMAGYRPLATGHFHQPLCAVYRREFAEIAEKALVVRRNNIVPLFAQVTTREIAEDEMLRLAFDPRMFDNLNTPEEWDQACRRKDKGATDPHR